MKKAVLFLSLSLFGVVTVVADDYDDDIYFNPKKENNVQTMEDAVYIGDTSVMGRTDVDVDTYNRRGAYYETAIDTIGAGVSSAEDFVYTQQLQKFYNPTIVVDNASVLNDVLNNSYGNVDIVIDNGVLAFAPYSYYGYGWPYYSRYNMWNDIVWGWAYPVWSWGYDPWYHWNPYWNWGWTWGPSWSPGWHPGGWHHGYGPGWADNHYRPNGNMTYTSNRGWANSSRPGMSVSHRGNGVSGGYKSGTGSVLNNHRNATVGGTNRVNNQNSVSGNSGSNSYNNHRQTNMNNNSSTYRQNNSNSTNNYRNNSIGNSTRSNSGSLNRGGSGSSSRSYGGGGSRGGGSGRHR